eukprot:449537_1
MRTIICFALIFRKTSNLMACLKFSKISTLLRTNNTQRILTQSIQSHYINTNVTYGYDTQQGKRNAMEDYIVHNNNFQVDNSLVTSGKHSLFSIFDGHYGYHCSKYLSENIEQYLSTNMKNCSNIEQVFENTMQQMDDNVLETRNAGNISNTYHKLYASGSTACMCLIDHNTNNIIISHVGDSRCVIIDNNNNINQLTIDHHPKYNKIEYERLKKIGKLKQDRYGNFPTWYGNGTYGVAMTRCIGNGHIKEEPENNGIFITTPDVIQYEWTENDKFLILCSDGLYNDLNELKQYMYLNNESVTDVAKTLTTCAIDSDITGDNVSVIVVQL